MPRLKEAPKDKLILLVPQWVIGCLDEHAGAVHSSRNKAAAELLIHGLAASRRVAARGRSGNATFKAKLWETWARQRALYWSLYHATTAVQAAWDKQVAGLARGKMTAEQQAVGDYLGKVKESYLPNMSQRIRYHLRLLAEWAGFDHAPEFIRNKAGNRYPCRRVAVEEFRALGMKKKLPDGDAL